jgi:hypothetical protein
MNKQHDVAEGWVVDSRDFYTIGPPLSEANESHLTNLSLLSVPIFMLNPDGVQFRPSTDTSPPRLQTHL